jgi:hypothetical protein
MYQKLSNYVTVFSNKRLDYRHMQLDCVRKKFACFGARCQLQKQALQKQVVLSEKQAAARASVTNVVN